MLNNDQIGKIAEMQFEIDCARKGFCTSWPRVDRRGYDCIIDTGEKLLKVQIKSTLKKKPDRDKYGIKFTKGRGSQCYSRGHFDVMAVYLHDIDMWYFMPYSAIENLKGIDIIIDRESKYNIYKNNWELLASSRKLKADI